MVAVIAILSSCVLVINQWRSGQHVSRLKSTSVLGLSREDAVRTLTAIPGIKYYDYGDTGLFVLTQRRLITEAAFKKLVHYRDGIVMSESDAIHRAGW